MDEYFDHLFSSSSWSDINVKERSSWPCSEPGQPNELLHNSTGLYKDDNKSSPMSMITSSHTMESLATQDTSSIDLGGESDYGVDKGLFCGEAPPENDGRNCNGNHSSNGLKNGTLKVGKMGLQYSIPTPDSLNLGSPEQLQLIGDMTSSLSFAEKGHVGCNGSEQSEFQRSLRDLQTLSSSPQWQSPPSYGGVSSLSLSPVMGLDRMQGFGLQGGILDNEIDTMGNRFVRMDKILQLDNLSASVHSKGNQELQNYPLSSLASGTQTMETVGLPSLPHLQTTSTTPTGGCNGSGKPRARARRGQATDPHSIAERLRREKIAERMKNLQELVPNSNKTDKASMLDEIIEYVKFLQLQVKVLSMSRLGAAGAVVPLITDAQAEGSNGLSLLPSAAEGLDISPSPDQIAFEQEVVKLMESDVTMAMQYLQSKALCLMPIALAAAISSRKPSSSGLVSEERKKFGFTNGLTHNNGSSSLPVFGTHHISHDSDNMIGKFNRDGITGNGCNGAIKQEEVKNTSRTARELKP